MLLESLVSIVATMIQRNEQETVEIIDNFVNTFGFTKFNAEQSFPYFFEIIAAMKEKSLVREQYNYTCLKYDESENTFTMMTSCVYCGKNINIVNGEHEIQSIYQIVKENRLKLLSELELRREKYMLDKYVMEDFKIHFEQLVKKKANLIPFMGSGLSVPFSLPDWKDMLKSFSKYIKKGYEGYYNDKLDEGDYFEALSYLKKSSLLNEDRLIQGEIVDLFEGKINMNIEKEYHNYLDVLDLQSDFYLTTNYDNIFSTLRNGFVPPLKWDDIENMQKFMEKKQQYIVHLHGVVHKPKSMIVTKESYDDLYGNADFMRILYTFMSNKSFLFLGFSFTDIYFKDLYNKITSKIEGDHFIILPNITFTQAQEFSKQNLKVIGINVTIKPDGKIDGQDLVNGIKTVLNSINKAC
ncbi:SIR2 family protein [Peribacillus sp. N1]